MGKTFDIVYDDFSGGHYFGAQDTKQPKNTWTGDDMIHVAADGMLMPGAVPVSYSNDTASYHVGYVAQDGAGLKYVRNASGFTFVHVGAGGSPFTISGGPADPSRIVDFYGKTLVCGQSSASIIVYTFFPSSLVYPTTPVGFDGIYAWGAWALGTSGKRLYFSAPYDATSWNSNDYLDIGDSAITAVVPAGSTLIVGTDTSGWWQVSGVLGQTATVRRITGKGAAGSYGVETDAGIMFGASGTPDQAFVRLLSGSQVQTVLWNPSLGSTNTNGAITSVAGQYVFAGVANAPKVFMWSEYTRNWRVVTIVDSTVWASSATKAATDMAVTTEYAFLALSGTDNAAATRQRIYRYLIDPFDPPYDAVAGAYTSATAELSGYDHPKPFTVTEVIVEVDCGTTAQNKTRAVSVQMVTNSAVMDYAASVASLHAAASSSQTATLPSLASTAGERVAVRFSPNNGGPTMTVTPRITLQGLKLRRCIVRCQEVN